MKIFLFYFEMAAKITGSAQKYRVGRVSRNTPIIRPKNGVDLSYIRTTCPCDLYPLTPNFYIVKLR